MERVASETGLLARKSVVYGLGNMLQRVTALVLLPVYTHYLTASDYGIKELLTISVDIVSVLVATAVSMALYRIYFQYDDEPRRRMVIGSAYVSLGVGGAAVVLALVPAAPTLAGLVLGDASLASYFHLAFAALWFQIINRISYDYLRARQQAVRVVVYSVIRLALALGLNIWFIVGLETGLVGVLWSSLITSAAMFVVVSIPQIRIVGLRFSREVMGELLGFGLPLVPSQLGGMVVHLSDRFFIKAMISIGDAGLYSLGYRLGTMSSMFVVEPFNQTWLPRRYEIHSQPDHETVFGRIFTYFVAASAFFALATSALAGDVLRVISAPQFWSAAGVVPVIAVANAIFGLHYHLNLGLMLAKRTKILAVINLSNAGIVLVLNWLLIPRFGVFGAAYATLLSFVYKVGLTWMFSRRHYSPRFERGRLARLVVYAAVLYGVSQLVTPPQLWLSASVHAAIVLAYPVLVWTLGVLGPEEKEQVRGAVRSARNRLRRTRVAPPPAG